MPSEQFAKAVRFRSLHESAGTFLMPNAWNAGSARMLAAAGFPAIATTSAGIAFSLGVPDYEGRVSRPEMMTQIGAIADAVEVPVSADLEAGYGIEPTEVAETIRQSVAAGVVGGNIEDHTNDPHRPLFEIDLAVDRIRAAREAADLSGIAYTLTARTDCYLVDHSDAFAESVRRANRYREAGADCLFVPGVKDAATIGALVREIDAPLNIVMGLVGTPLTVAELARLGVRRISIGGSLARATFALVRRAADEMKSAGTFTYAADQIPDAELCAFFAASDRREQ